MAQDTRQGLQIEANMYGIPDQGAPPVTAVPSGQEFTAKMNEYMPKTANPLVTDLQRATDEVRQTNPEQADTYQQLVDDVMAQEAWNAKEQARRKAQHDMAWEEYYRKQDAARRRDIREYEDDDPSWGYSMMEQPFVKNTVGVRRYNPYTGEMEWHYPRNAAEGVSTGLSNLLNIAYGGIAGLAGHPFAGQQLRDRNMAIQQDKFYSPYKLDNAIMQSVISGHGPAIPQTLADAASADIAGKELLNTVGQRWVKQATDAEHEKLKSDYNFIKETFGDEAAKNYLYGKWGVKNPQTSAAYDAAMSLSQAAADSRLPEDFELAKQALQQALTVETDATKRAEIINRLQTLGDQVAGAAGETYTPARMSKRAKRNEDLLLSEMLSDGTIDDAEWERLMSDPVVKAELDRIQRFANAQPEDEREEALQQSIKASNAARNLTRGWSDIPNIIGMFTSTVPIGNAIRRKVLHKYFPNSWIGKLDTSNINDRKMLLQEELLRHMTEKGVTPAPSSVQAQRQAVDTAKAKAIQDEMSRMNTSADLQ